MARVTTVLIAILTVLPLLGDERPPVYRAESYGIREVSPPAVRRNLADPDIVLAEPANLPLGGNPPIAGIVRPLVATSTERSLPTTFRSEGAARVRLFLTHISMSTDAVAWVSGKDGTAIAFGADLLYDGTIWTPSVAGDSIELILPQGSNASVAAIGHIAADTRPAPTSQTCFIDVSCTPFADRDGLSKSVAHIIYRKAADGLLYVCTGGLINGPEGDRLFLTANHCISAASEAASAEFTWDDRTASCGTFATPDFKTTGATLLVTSAATDVTLLRLNSLPSGRWLMGWTTRELTAGTTLHRISQPSFPDGTFWWQQFYSSTLVDTSSTIFCSKQRPQFLHSRRSVGGVDHGSSGSPVIIDGGYIVGQLYGQCGSAFDDGCSPLNTVVDGAMRASYSVLQPYLRPDTTTTCVPSSTVACLLSNRFRVSIDYFNPIANQPGTFLTARLNQQAGINPDTAIFGFSSAQNVEVIVRVQDTRPFAARFDVYYGGMTDFPYTVTVMDTKTSVSRQYTNKAGLVGGGVDRTSFPAN